MKLAIIGASIGQRPLCIRAKEKGYDTISFAWEKGAICRDLVDRFYPISITDQEKILAVCREERIDGVVTNASEMTVEAAAYVATNMGLHGLDVAALKTIKNKAEVRRLTNSVEGLTPVPYLAYRGEEPDFYPCVVKPATYSGKRGVSYVPTRAEFAVAVDYARDAIRHGVLLADNGVLVEKFIEGTEVSVETISYENRHFVLQITDKRNTGAPHFVELEHHQPSVLPDSVQERIRQVVPRILTAVRFANGPAHIEIKIGASGEIYLMEVNPRGGGGTISNLLVGLTTGYDYVGGMIDVACGKFTDPVVRKVSCAGTYYLYAQTSHLLPIIKSAETQPWFLQKHLEPVALNDALNDRLSTGYLVYHWDRRLVLSEP